MNTCTMTAYDWDAVQNAPQPAPNLAESIQRLLAAKTAANKSQIYVKALNGMLAQFLRFAGDVPLAQISVEVLDAWFKARAAHAPATRATELNRLSTLFTFAVRRRWLSANPCDQLERIAIDCKPPKILTPADADALLENCPPRLMPWLVLGMFCGLRPEAEIQRLDRADIDLERQRVQIVAGKIRTRWRFVPIPDRAVPFLRQHLGDTVCPSHVTIKRDRRTLRACIGDCWPSDILRHTAASYWLAFTGDIGLVATVLGNSPQILARHYNGLATPEDAATFFGGTLCSKQFSTNGKLVSLK
jgi:integrase